MTDRRLLAAGALAGACFLLAPSPARAADFPWPAAVAGGANPLLGTPWPANGRNAAADARIRVRLLGRRGPTAIATHAAGGRLVLRGRLADGADRPIAGAVVIVARELVDREGWRAVARARTSAHGRFRAPLSPGWAARRFGVVYWPFAASAAPVSSPVVLERVTPRITLHAARLGGGLVRLHGRVAGSRQPPGGVLVALQVRNRGAWVGVRLVHASAAGHFSGRYRFAVRGRRFAVRAQVPHQAGWRLQAGASRVLRVAAR